MWFLVRVQAPPGQTRLGVNFQCLADWDTELPFIDVFHEARQWISQKEGEPWGKGPALDLDEKGWIRSLAPKAYATAPLVTINNGHVPQGVYTVLYDGEGDLTFLGAKIKEAAPGRVLIEVSKERGFMLEVRKTNPGNYVRNIRVLLPGFTESDAKEVFHPRFVERWSGVACFRFMGWMMINGSQQVKWSDRPKLDDATWTLNGPPLEVMIDLCNRQKIDAWLNIPHVADDDYIEKFARLVKEKLDPSLRVYVEYSNEVWNSAFEQNRYACDKGKELGLGDADKPWVGGGLYYVRRSVEVMKICERVFSSDPRLVRVFAWQTGSTFWMENILLKDPEQIAHFDVYAVAPYMAFMPNADSKPSSDEVATWTVDQVLDHLERTVLPEEIKTLRPQVEAAAKFKLALVAYEGGQHLLAPGAANQNKKLVEVLKAANGHPRMGDIYTKYLNAWKEAGGGLFNHWVTTGEWTQWGSWGLLEYADQKPDDVPKCRATLDWAASLGQTVGK
jgi:hypothetical protein